MQDLTEKQQSIIAVAAHTAAGDMERLRPALDAGLDAGLGVAVIKEILLQLYAYCGFPRSLNAVNAFMEVLDKRHSEGVTALPGAEASPIPPDRDRDAYGAAARAALAGQGDIPPPSGYQRFLPSIDAFLKEHLFADIFGRDNLDWQSRELASIAALAAMPGTEGQLRFHLGAALNTGLTEAELRSFADHVGALLGQERGASALAALEAALSERPAAPVPASREAVEAHTANSLRRIFARGDLAPARFTGRAYINMLMDDTKERYDCQVYDVLFEAGCRNDWHKHSLGQILLATVGRGFYQERGKAARALAPGDVVEIPPNVEHWHGAAPDSAFTHIGITPKAGENTSEWLGPVTDAEYAAAAAFVPH